jgi:polysaccharide pyruvyl transferase WcaK-like protein
MLTHSQEVAESSPVESRLHRAIASRTSLSKVTILDTAAAGTNLGDQIIMEAVRDETAALFADYATFTVATHEWMGAQSRRLIRQSDWTIAGGTSLLSSRMWFRANWKVKPIDALSHLDVVLLGAGWYQYQGAADPLSRWMLRSLLSRKRLHSVRDSYALAKLASIGMTNAVNTGCPTLWRLSAEHCARLPRRKAESVLTTVNSYPKLFDREADRRMLAILRQSYRNVYLWIQTHSDFEYARALDPNLAFVNPSLSALDAVLASELDIDYVGNRLHAGIRALQKGRRAIIVEIDNRAREMGRDFGLPTVERTDFAKLGHMIGEHAEIAVRPPWAEIERWKRQFRSPDPTAAQSAR